MRSFYRDLELEVPEEVYEPREDSFLLAEALEEIDIEKKRVLDIGTGCGIQALVCAKEAEKVLGTDINPKAVKTAKKNAKVNGIKNVSFIESDLFEKVEGKFDLIVFNPPYLPSEGETSSLQEKAWEGGKEGREIIDRFLEKFKGYLKENGSLLLIQSSLSSPEDTLEKIKSDFDAKIIREEKVPWERLVVIKASKR